MKLSLPSWLVPGTWLENLKAAQSLEWVSGMELLFFSWDALAKDVLAREIAGIGALAPRFDYSLHLPDPLSPDAEELVRLTRPFTGAYVFHPPRPEASPDAVKEWAKLIETWKARYGDVFLLEYTGREAFAAAEDLLGAAPLCADTGCLLRDGIDPESWIRERRERVRRIHLHGVKNGKDHAPLVRGESWLEGLIPLLEEFPGSVEIELFDLGAAKASYQALTGRQDER